MPFIRGWLLRRGLQPADADNVGQDVLLYVVKKLPEFRRAGDGAFGGWLRANLNLRVKEFWAERRRDGVPVAADLNDLADPDSPVSRLFEQEHDDHVRRELLAFVRSEVGENAWLAFESQFLHGQSAAETAARLNLSVATVVSHKCRVLKRLRDESRGWVD